MYVDMYIYIHIDTHIHTYIYIYMYIYVGDGLCMGDARLGVESSNQMTFDPAEMRGMIPMALSK